MREERDGGREGEGEVEGGERIDREGGGGKGVGGEGSGGRGKGGAERREEGHVIEERGGRRKRERERWYDDGGREG